MPTRFGWWVSALATLLFAVSVVLGYRELTVLACTGVVAVPLAMLAIPRRLHLDAVIRIRPLRLERGGSAELTIVFHTSGNHPVPAFSCRIPRCEPVEVDGLAGGASGRLSVRLADLPRGTLAVGPVSVRWSDPFGLVERKTTVGDAAACVVHPKVVPLPVVRPDRRSAQDGSSGRQSAEGSASFQTIRPYSVGDDPRHIHWWSTARIGSLQVRRYHDVPIRTTTLILDTRRSSYPDQAVFEDAVDVAASVLVAAARLRQPLRLHGTGGLRPVSGGDGRHDRNRVLDALSAAVLVDAPATTATNQGLPSNRVPSLATALDEMRRGRRAHQDGLLTVVTGTEDTDDAVKTARSALADHSNVVLVRVGRQSTPTRRDGGKLAGPNPVMGRDGVFTVQVATVNDAPSAWLMLADRVGVNASGRGPAREAAE